MPRNPKKPRRLVTDDRVHLWTLRHSHRRPDGGRAVDCTETLTLSPQPSGTGGPLRIVFAERPDHYVPGSAYTGSGDVGLVRGASLNLHEPGAVRALLDTALAHGWDPDDRHPTVLDGWPLLDEAAAALAARRAGVDG
ncbi:hypothetical protein [Kitasatospora purpeofusca]|uniref:hypothetical protein n=1 Tax=Kitasatospora purpeofusca TaxID=67352 RepID=UPI003658CEC3